MKVFEVLNGSQVSNNLPATLKNSLFELDSIMGRKKLKSKRQAWIWKIYTRINDLLFKKSFICSSIIWWKKTKKTCKRNSNIENHDFWKVLLEFFPILLICTDNFGQFFLTVFLNFFRTYFFNVWKLWSREELIHLFVLFILTFPKPLYLRASSFFRTLLDSRSFLSFWLTIDWMTESSINV